MQYTLNVCIYEQKETPQILRLHKPKAVRKDEMPFKCSYEVNVGLSICHKEQQN